MIFYHDHYIHEFFFILSDLTKLRKFAMRISKVVIT